MVESVRFLPRVKTIASTVKRFRSVRRNQEMSSHIRGNQYCANRSMSREPKHLETCRMSFHVRGNQYCANRSMSREQKHLESCRITTKYDCSPFDSMLARSRANHRSWESIQPASMPIPSDHLSIPGRIVDLFRSIVIRPHGSCPVPMTAFLKSERYISRFDLPFIFLKKGRHVPIEPS